MKNIGYDRFLTKKEYAGTVAYGVGNALKLTFSTFLAVYLASWIGLEEEYYILTNAILLGLSFWDIVNDVLIGNFIDKRRGHKKLGRFKPFIFLACVPCMLLPILQALPLGKMNAEIPQAALVAYVVALYFLFDISSTFFNSSANALLGRFTPSDRERGFMQGIMALVASPFGMASSVILIVASAITGLPQDNHYVYLIGVIFSVVVGMPLSIYIFIVGKERITSIGEKPAKLKDVYKDIIKNRPLMALMTSEILAFGFFMTGFAYNFICLNLLADFPINFFGSQGGAGVMLLLSVTTIPTTLISLAIAPVIRKKFSDRTLFIAVRLFSGICYLIMFFTTLGVENYSVTSLFIRIAIPYVAHGLTTGFYSVLPNVMTYDCLDYGEWKFGRRADATIFAVRGTMGRICNEIVGKGLGPALIVAIGLKAAIDASEATKTPLVLETDTKSGLLLIFTLLPAIFSFLCCVPLFFYNYTGKNKRKIEEELKARRAEAKKEEFLPQTEQTANSN